MIYGFKSDTIPTGRSTEAYNCKRSGEASMGSAIYARCSTNKQDLSAQIETLQNVATKAGWGKCTIFSDFAISGSKGREERAGLDQVLVACSRREVDRILVFDISRLGRSISSLISTLEAIRSSGAAFYCHQQNIDSATASGRAMFGMISVFAEFEREMIVARVRAGLDRARAKGIKLGRKPVSLRVREQVTLLRGQKMTQMAIARKIGISQAKVSQILSEST